VVALTICTREGRIGTGEKKEFGTLVGKILDWNNVGVFIGGGVTIDGTIVIGTGGGKTGACVVLDRTNRRKGRALRMGSILLKYKLIILSVLRFALSISRNKASYIRFWSRMEVI